MPLDAALLRYLFVKTSYFMHVALYSFEDKAKK